MTLTKRFCMAAALGAITMTILGIADGFLQSAWLHELIFSDYFLYSLGAFWFALAPVIPIPLDRSESE